jgi:hypothetical protein
MLPVNQRYSYNLRHDQAVHTVGQTFGSAWGRGGRPHQRARFYTTFINNMTSISTPLNSIKQVFIDYVGREFIGYKTIAARVLFASATMLL